MAQNEWVDLRGLHCPEPVMMLHAFFRQVRAGARVRVIATDPTTEHDIPRFCHNLGHALHQASVLDCLPESFTDSLASADGEAVSNCKGYYYYEIEKGGNNAPG